MKDTHNFFNGDWHLSVMINEDDIIEIDDLINHFQDRYNSRSDFIRSAVIYWRRLHSHLLKIDGDKREEELKKILRFEV